MAAMNALAPLQRQSGASMIEVLVTLVVIAIGLLGLAGLQYRVQLSDMETHQRAQALVLLQDMAARISTKRAPAATYVTTAANPLGAGVACPNTIATRQEIDALQWCNALQGAAEVQGAGKVGAMIGARGCVESLPNNEYLITVAWQGLTAVSAPPAGVACGANLYDAGANTSCTADRCRRVVTTVVRIATLS
jgi:type IV pilus assembly protein PilV